MDEQMYREVIRTLEFIKKAYENLTENATGMGRLVGEGIDCPVRIKTYEELYQYHAAVMQMAVEALEEVQQYQELGTVRELKALKERSLTGLELAKIAVIIQKFKKYEAVGTVEECREARGRCKEKKWERGIDKDVRCPICGTYTTDIFEHRYCTYCGQRLV